MLTILDDITIYISGGRLKIHGYEYLTAIEYFGVTMPLTSEGLYFGRPTVVCSSCVIDLSLSEAVERIRYRTGIHGRTR